MATETRGETTIPADTTTMPGEPASQVTERPARRRASKRLLLIVGVLAAVGLAVVFVTPLARTALTTVSTDDAYVNAHVTYVAPRISETVVEVRVDDTDFVRKGDLLVVLDKDVWRVRVAQAEAALDVARKEATRQLAAARAATAKAKADHFKLVSAMTEIRNRVAQLRATIASLREQQAAERLAQREAARFNRLGQSNAASREDVEIRQTQYDQARASVVRTLEQIHSLRAALEVPEDPPPGKPLDDVPPDIDQKHSTVVSALAVFAQDLADLGLDLPRYNETPSAYIDRIHALATKGDLDALIEKSAAEAPTVASARAEVKRAETDLDRARLDLSYCEITADIDGFVSNRNVNPGNRVEAGQRLMALRSSSEVWIDANFKETQLEPIRIGHPVDLYVDAYPGKVFKGRVEGFSPGTGQSLALLPPQNATGNFVKIVQRLPVRIALVGGNPQDTPLFVGLSVRPYVRIQDRPEGPHAGRRLKAVLPRVVRSAPAAPPAAEARPSSPPAESRAVP